MAMSESSPLPEPSLPLKKPAHTHHTSANQEADSVHLSNLAHDFAQHKAMMTALREHEGELRSVLEGAGIATWKWDARNDRVLFQRNVDTMYGLNGPIETYAQLMPFIHPDDLPKNIAAIGHSLATGDKLEIEYRVLRPDGVTIWVAAIASLIQEDYGAGSQPVFAGIKMDITARKQAEENLRVSEARYRALAEGGSKFVWINRADGYTIYVNPQWTHFTGLTLEQTVGTGWSNVIHPDDRKHVFNSYRRALANGTTHETQLRYRRASDGEFRWYIMRSTPLRDENGTIQHWMGVAMDIHAQKQAETALRESEERFRLASEAMNGMVYEWNILSGQTQHSKGLFNLIGLYPHQMPQNHNWWRERIHSEDWPRVEASLADAARARSPIYDAEYRIRHEAGYSVWVWDSSSLVYDESGALIRMIGCIISIDERKKAERENERLLREAQEASRLKDEFLAVVSHELRTPLNAILGWAHLCNSGGLGSEEIPHALEVIERNARAQAQIVEDILDVARVVSGKMRIEIAPVALGELAREVIESVRPTAEAKSIALHERIAPALPIMHGDAGRLRQIIWNLLSNAVKFTPQNGNVTLEISQSDSALQLQVSDSGQGIEPDFLPFVFDRFRQADGGTTRRHGGLGLGLSLVRHLTEAHGGSIAVHSEGKDRGSVFTVNLPLRPSQASAPLPQNSAPDAPQTPQQAAPNPANLAGARFLIVDDAPDALQLIASLLHQAGATAETATSVAEARSKISTQPFDLVLSDLGMPNEDGYALVAWLRAWTVEHDTPLPAVALTAYASLQERARVLGAGFVAFVPKPIDPDELMATITRILGR